MRLQLNQMQTWLDNIVSGLRNQHGHMVKDWVIDYSAIHHICAEWGAFTS